MTVFRSALSRDSFALAKLICLADQAHRPVPGYRLALGDNEVYRLQVLERLVTAITLQPFHYSLFIVAEIDGVVVSGVCGYEPHKVGMHNLNRALREIGWDESQIAGLYKRIIPAILPMSEPEPWCMDHVATLAGWRRRGLMRELLTRIVARGEDLGYRSMQVDVLIGNLSAQRAYEQVGFRVVAEYTSDNFVKAMGCPGIARMIRMQRS